MTTPREALEAMESALLAANVPGQPRVDVFISDAKPLNDKDGAVHAHIVLHPSPGVNVREEESLDSGPGQRRWRCQTTCVGGDTDRALRAVERVQSALVGQQLFPTSGFIREEGDLGNVVPDRSVSPNRWFVPIDLVLDL